MKFQQKPLSFFLRQNDVKSHKKNEYLFGKCFPGQFHVCISLKIVFVIETIQGVNSLPLIIILKLCQEPAFTKTPLAMVGAWRFRNTSKEYEDA